MKTVRRSARVRTECAALAAVLALGCADSEPASNVADSASPANRLYVWTGDADSEHADFLAVFDADVNSPRYGQLLSTVPVDGRGNWPHHTEYALESQQLFANAWGTGRTFVFDLAQPDQPRVATVFAERGGYGYAHSYARLPNGNVLATFQAGSGTYTGGTGGLVELDRMGEVVRSVSGSSSAMPRRETWPYSLLVLPQSDRVVTTNTRMGLVSEWTNPTHVHADADARSPFVQIWRLSDLSPVAVLELPPQAGGHADWPAEPRRLANGDVYVNTFSCGLYRIDGVETDAPRIEPVLHSRFEKVGYCAVPVVLGNFWIQPSATERAIVAYDLSDRANPREASKLPLDSAFAAPHWIALDPKAPRIVVTSDEGAWLLLINVDPASGALTIDERFREAGAARPGFNFDRADWPHGAGGRAMPHGTVFSAATAR